jgi:hypothetical protein
MATPLDELAPNFRKAMERWPEAATLADHYKAVDQCHCGSTHGLAETAKSFIECVCITILGEYGKAMPSSTPSTTELLVECLGLLGIKNTRGASKLDKVLSAHNKLADALSDMRNENGPVAHGKDGFLDALTATQLRAYLLTGDTLLAVILAALEGTEPDLLFTREPYERFAHLHARIDNSVSVECSVLEEEGPPVVLLKIETSALKDGIELRVEPSRLLYAIDRTAYLELLGASADAATIAVEAPSAAVAASPRPAETAPAGTPEEPVHAAVVTAYDGELAAHKDSLSRYLATLHLPAVTPPTPAASLVDSMLATAEQGMGVDWRARESLQARMRVALRRRLVEFGVPELTAKDCAEHVVTLLRNQTVPGNGAA